MSSSSAKYMVEKFDGGNNFNLWKIRMRSSLVLQGLSRAIDNVWPANMDDSEKKEIMEKAKSAVFMSVTDRVLREIAGEATAAAVWAKLEDLYSGKSLANRLLLKKRLYNLRMNEGTPVANHLDDFNSIIMDLENVGIKIDPEDQALILLSSLPASYETFVDTILYGKDDITLEDVSNNLRSKELKKSFPENRAEGSGLMVRGRTQNRDSSKKKSGRSKSRGRKLSCFECGEQGHFRRDCPKLKEKKGKSVESSANVVDIQVDSDDSDGLGDVLSVSSRVGQNSWILDSGATFHMSPHKSWFDSYKQMSGTVYLGNDAELSIDGIGSIRVKMFDGVIRVLECWHVPKIRKNLISLSTLDAQGYKYHSENGVLKVCKGSMVLMKGKLEARLYVLQGSTVLGEAVVASSSNGGVSGLSQSQLWHLRLGHMSDKGLSVLGKRKLLNDYVVTSFSTQEEEEGEEEDKEEEHTSKTQEQQTSCKIHTNPLANQLA